MHDLANLDTLIYNRNKDVGFNHAKDISRPFKCLQEVLDWCTAECKPGWRWQLVDTPSDIRDGRYIFFFNDEKDYCAFCLKWG
jgi:hypothetical protein